MSVNDFKPGDVARVQNPHGVWNTAILQVHPAGRRWVYDVAYDHAPVGVPARRLVVIDPEDREQVERLRDLMDAAWVDQGNGLVEARTRSARGNAVQAALREFANPMPEQPTDPTARVVDCRDNYWRLLADGDWVCVDGPDSGEYLPWTGLAGRGPLTVEGVSS